MGWSRARAALAGGAALLVTGGLVLLACGLDRSGKAAATGPDSSGPPDDAMPIDVLVADAADARTDALEVDASDAGSP